MVMDTGALMMSSRVNDYKNIFLFGLSAIFLCTPLFVFSKEKSIENKKISQRDALQEYDAAAKSSSQPTTPAKAAYAPKIIKRIILKGNKLVDKNAILNSLPYKIGEKFDPRKTRKLIRNLYYGLKRFKDIQVEGELVGTDGINLYIILVEKNVLKDIIFLPEKKTITDAELKKKINVADIPAIDEFELKRYEQEIKKMYLDKSYHQTKVTSSLKIDPDGKAVATFTIDEGKKSRVKKVDFKGNKNVSGKDLRKILFTREDWILGFLDNAGNLQPDRLDADKHMLEQFYQNKGYLKAKVTHVDVDMDDKTKHFTITFHIDEGDIYTVKDVKVPGKEILKDEYLEMRVPIKPGDLYSRKKIMDAMKTLEFIWGDFGYLYAHIEPSIQPDDENKTVNVAFYSELGDKVRLNKINIIGNKKTKDKVIRRKIALREGDLISNKRMEMSKYNVESLGFFDKRDGVNWKITRLDKENADLDLILKEEKTGHAGIKVGFGGSVQNLTAANSGFSVSVDVNDTNLFGTGMSTNLAASFAKGQKSIIFNLTDPWLFDKPITGALDIYHKRPTYSEFRTIRPVSEKLTGGGVTLGFVSPRLRNTQVLFRVGGDSVRYEKIPEPVMLSRDFIACKDAYQNVLCKLFHPGTYFWFETSLGQDFRDHPMHTSRGYKWALISKYGTSACWRIGYYKMDFDWAWFTPLIGQHDLVFRFHTYFGFVKNIRNKLVPYRELFHIGGPASVRGFLFGQISPEFFGDSIGASKAMFVNAELLFPITQDFNIKGVLFYDGGTGWDFPYSNDLPPGSINNNNFNFRHAVGFGFRMLNPVPVRIDWGFKLDRRKKLGETPSEVHFGMTYDW